MKRGLFAIAIGLIAVSCNNGAKEPTIKVGESAPGFTVESLDGKTIRFEDFKGKPLVLTFMAEWCPCSKESAPVFKKAYAIYRPKGIEFMMLGFQDSRAKFKNFVEREGFGFPSAFDKNDKIGESYGVRATPTTFFISKEGRIERMFYGKIVEIEKLSGWIEELLAKKREDNNRS